MLRGVSLVNVCKGPWFEPGLGRREGRNLHCYIDAVDPDHWLLRKRRRSKGGNSLRLQLQGPPAPANSGLNSRLVIFDENKAASAGPSEPKLESWMSPPPSRSKENEKWSNVKMPMKSRFGHSVVAPPSKPNFQPFVEESDQPPAMTL